MTELLSWESALLEAAGLTGVFYGRAGGVSSGELSSLNLGAQVGDSPASLAENERRVLADLRAVGLYLPRQIHGDRVRRVSHPVAGVVRGEPGDAVITDEVGLAIGVLTADCVPILFGSRDGGAIGVIHAGWRGLRAGLIGRAIERFTGAFRYQPREIIAAIGPAIGPRTYEVDRALAAEFLRERPDLGGVIWPDKRRKPHLDLRLMALNDLLGAGLESEAVEIVGPTTDDERFFSHRRSGGRAGRQLSAVLRNS